MTHRVAAFACLPFIALIFWGCGDDKKATEPTPTVIGSSWRLAETGITNTPRAFASNDNLSLLVGDGGIVYSSTDGVKWDQRRVGGPNDGLQDVIWFDSLFVAVGMNGTLIVSSNGTDWRWVGIDDLANMTGLAESDSLIVAVGEGGSIYVSDDGINWVLHRQDATEAFSDVAFRDSTWVACTDNGRVRWSKDAITWDSATTVFGDDTQLPAVTAADSAFYMVAVDPLAGPTDRCHVYRSANGSNWFVQAGIDAWYIHDLFWTGSALVAVGEGTGYQLGYPDGLLFSSNDGTAWTQQSTEAPFSLTCVGAFKNQVLVGGSGGYVLAGTAPNQLPIVTSGAEMTGVLWNGTEFVAVTDRGTVMRSTNGTTWSETHSHASVWFDRLAFSGSIYAALGGAYGVPNEIYSSADGHTWAKTLAFQDVVLKDITWGNGNFVACGQDGTVFLSGDGQAWTPYFVGDSVTLRTVIWDGSRYLAAATGIVYTSDDGMDWAKPAVDSTDTEPTISRLVWTGSIYCAVGTTDTPPAGLQGHAYVSTDAVHWQAYDIPVHDFLYDLAWTGTRLVACGRGGTMAVSADGSSWEALASLTDYSLKGLAVGGGRSVAVGSNRTVLVSP